MKPNKSENDSKWKLKERKNGIMKKEKDMAENKVNKKTGI